MNLSNAIVIENITNEQTQTLLNTLTTAKTVLTLTIPTPNLNWRVIDGMFVINGNKNELNIVMLTLRNTLGLLPDDEEDVEDYPL